MKKHFISLTLVFLLIASSHNILRAGSGMEASHSPEAAFHEQPNSSAPSAAPVTEDLAAMQAPAVQQEATSHSPASTSANQHSHRISGLKPILRVDIQPNTSKPSRDEATLANMSVVAGILSPVMMVAGLVFGLPILIFFPIMVVLAIALGVASLRRETQGRGRAKIGITLGAIFGIIGVIVVLMGLLYLLLSNLSFSLGC